MVSIRTINKITKSTETKSIESKIKEEFDPSKEKIDDIKDIMDNRTYYVATINNLDIPLILFGKMVQQKHPSEQIKVSRQVFNELKKDKYFYTEILKDEQGEKKLIGVETIIIPADVSHHHRLEDIIKQSTISILSQTSIIQQIEKPIEKSKLYLLEKYPQLKLDRKPSIFQENIFDYIIMLANSDPRATQKHLVVEAVAGCISGNSVIYTNNGLITIKELYNKKSKNIKVACSDLNGGTEFKEIDEYFKLEDKDIIKITTKFGFELKCTPEHKLLTLDKNGVLKFEEAKNLSVNDTISIYYNANSFGENQKMRWDIGQSLISDHFSDEESEKLPVISKGIISYGTTGGRRRGKNVACTYPYIMNDELAEFLGYFISEGNLNRGNTVSISNTDDKINERINYLYKNLFNLDSNVIIEKRKENADYGRTVNSVGLSKFLELMGLNEKSMNKEIPKEILMSSKEVHISFLKALFSGDGYIVKDKKMVGYSSMSENLCKQIQLMLLNLGIYSNLDSKVVYCNDKCCGKSYYISMYGNDAINYRDLIGFTLEYRQTELFEICKHIDEDGTWNSRTMKGLGSYISKIYDEFKKHGNWGNIREYYIDAYGTKAYKCYSAHDSVIKRGCSDIRNNISERRCPSKQKLYKILIVMKECNYMDEYKYLMNLCNLNVEYENIESIEYGKEDVYDLNIRDFHHYIANGFIVHNSGKTFTIEQATKLVPRNKMYVFLSFSYDIKEEFKRRRPDANALSFNGAGNTAVREKLDSSGKINKKFDINNVNIILNNLFENKYSNFNLEEMDELRPVVRRLVSLYKATGLTKLEEKINNITVKIDVGSLYNLIEEYDISTECDHSDLRMLCEDVLNINFNIFTNNWNGYDYDDQIWLPAIRNDIKIEQYDYVFVDETQDLNKTQLDLAIKICRQDGSIIAVGDRNQSIYGFRGADADAIPRIIDTLNAKVFPLSITYRCAKSHVNAIKEYARNLSNEEYNIEFKEAMEKFEYATLQNSEKEAIEGEVIPITFNQVAEKAKGIDKIICRNNAPLVKIFFQLIRNHKKAIILGKDFGEELKNIVKKVGGNTIQNFRSRLEKWYTTKRDKLLEEDKSIEKVTDQFETLNILSEDLESIDNLKTLIKDIFEESEKSDKITLCTVHKAKGLEVKTINDSVFVIKSYSGNVIMPSPRAKTIKAKKQENNLMYVAYTRGKNKMYIVE